LLRSGDEAHIKKVFLAYRPKFLQWIQSHYKIEYNDAEDIFQKSFIILYNKMRTGMLDDLQSSLETYFYGIGKNVLRDYKNQKYKQVISFPEKQKEVGKFDPYQKSEEEIHRAQFIGRLLHKVGEPCKTILKLYYYDRFAMEAIANKLGYKNESVITKKKYQCILKIRNLLKQEKENS